ncbi:MAG: glycosyltransferase family protein [Candidatus Cloacimonadaceae bacterium]
MVGRGLNPPHIRYYISDHGYGHASRSIALIRGLQRDIGAIISIRTHTSADFVSRSLFGCQIDKQKNDVGPIMDPATSSVDTVKTEIHLKTWVESWDNFVQEETKYCQEHSVNLIISDITPLAFLVGKECGIPSVAVSNFTWDLIYSELFGEIREVKMIRDAYSCADIALVLPLHEPMSVFKKQHRVPLLTRPITSPRDKMRAYNRIESDDIMVYIGSGLSVNMIPDCLDQLVKSGYKILLSGNYHHKNDGIIHIPSKVTETQNYIGMCDLVVTKSAYSTVSEAIQGKIPLLMYHRDGIAEDPYIIDPVVSAKIGKATTWSNVNSGDWIEDIPSLLSQKNQYDTCNDIFMRDGVKECIDYIRTLL